MSMSMSMSMSHERNSSSNPFAESESVSQPTSSNFDKLKKTVSDAFTISDAGMNKILNVLSYIPVIGTGVGIKFAINAWSERNTKQARTNLQILEICMTVLSLRVVYLAVSETASAVKSCYTSCASKIEKIKNASKAEGLEDGNSGNEGTSNINHREEFSTFDNNATGSHFREGQDL